MSVLIGSARRQSAKAVSILSAIFAIFFFCPARPCSPRQAASSYGPRWRRPPLPPPPLTALAPGGLLVFPPPCDDCSPF
jgi:hypothetical protein